MAKDSLHRPAQLGQFLRGIRVLDLSHYISGPLASLTFADMGADVLKVEPPNGDAMQQLGPRDSQGRAVFYQAINAGKSTLRLDLKDRNAHAHFLQLVEQCDVLIEGFRPGVMTRLGLDYETLCVINPGLVYCSISGYGNNTGQANKAGHDANYLAQSGVLDRNGSDRPVYFDPPIADATGGLYAALAILGAIVGRARNGIGTCIDLGLADVVMPLQQFQIADFSATGYVPKRGQTYLNGGAAYYNIYQTSDKQHVVIGAVEDKFWRAFCLAAERPQWIERQTESIPQHALLRDIGEFFRQLSASQCDEHFAHIDCCYSRVAALDEALASAHVKQRQLVRGDEGGLQALFPAWVGTEPPQARTQLKQVEDTYTWPNSSDQGSD